MILYQKKRYDCWSKNVESVDEREEIMTYAEMFAKVKGMLMDADVSDIHEHLAYQFNITG